MTAREAGTHARFATQITRFEKKIQDAVGRVRSEGNTV